MHGKLNGITPHPETQYGPAYGTIPDTTLPSTAGNTSEAPTQ